LPILARCIRYVPEHARAVRLAFRREGCIDETGLEEVGSFVTVPSYDIVKKGRQHFVWVEAAHDIESAKKRVDELSRQSDAEFVIFNEHTLQVVETLETLISF